MEFRGKSVSDTELFASKSVSDTEFSLSVDPQPRATPRGTGATVKSQLVSDTEFQGLEMTGDQK
jgi:hypothetical protein